MLDSRLYIYIYALSILMFILGYTLWSTSKRTKTMWLFVNSLCWNIAVLLFEGSSWVFMRSTALWAIRSNFIANTLLYSINTLPMISFYIYFDYRVISKKLARKKRIIIYATFALLMLTLNISNYWTGILFKISDLNVYTRGPGMYYTVGISLVALLCYGLSMLKHLRGIEGRLLGVMFSFTIMPIVGAIVQAYNYGIPAMWTMFSLLSLFIFIFIEREDMMKDTLTNLVTRGQFEQRLKKKLKRSKAFTLIMIDMDKFKLINDTYGHDEGDLVLVAVSNILEEAITHLDMASRYGGDEFMVLVESPVKEAGKDVVAKIDSFLSDYNEKDIKPYNIQLSMGAYYVKEPLKAHYADVLGVVDENMYLAKRNK